MASPLRCRPAPVLALGAAVAALSLWLLPWNEGRAGARLGQELRAPSTSAEAGIPAILATPTRASQREARTPGTSAEEPARAWPRVALRIVDEHGSPLAAERFAGWIDGPFPPPKLGSDLCSDADGRLVLEVPGHPHPGEERALALRSQRTSYPVPGRLPLPSVLDPARVTDLGELVMPAPPARKSEPVMTLVSGVVVDEQGRGVPSAEIVLRPALPRADLHAASAASGRFALVGPEPCGKGYLGVSAPGFLALSQAVEAGTHDLRVTLRPEASFEARILFDEGLPVHTLRFGLLGAGGEHSSIPFAEHLSLPQLEPGEYALLLRTVPWGWELERFDGIVLRAGTHPPEPRFAPLDLRGRLARLVLRLEASDGSPLTGIVRVRHAGEEVDEWFPDDGDGRVLRAVPAGAELELEPLGFRPRLVRPLPVEQVLVFARQGPP